MNTPSLADYLRVYGIINTIINASSRSKINDQEYEAARKVVQALQAEFSLEATEHYVAQYLRYCINRKIDLDVCAINYGSAISKTVSLSEKTTQQLESTPSWRVFRKRKLKASLKRQADHIKKTKSLKSRAEHDHERYSTRCLYAELALEIVTDSEG